MLVECFGVGSDSGILYDGLLFWIGFYGVCRMGVELSLFDCIVFDVM